MINKAEKSNKIESFEPLYSMKIPILDNKDNFRIDKVIEDYRSKINTIAKFIVPERKEPQKADPLLKNPDALALMKFKKENTKGLMKINDALLMNKILNKDSLKNHQNLISRLSKGDTKFMAGIPQIKTKEGISLNSPINKKKLNKYKTFGGLELKNIDDSFENKITEKEKQKDSHRKSNFKESAFFITGVAQIPMEKRVEFQLIDDPGRNNTLENLVNPTTNKKKEGSSNKSLINFAINDKKESLKNLYSLNLNSNNFQGINHDKKGANILSVISKYRGEMQINENEDSDIFSVDDKYMSMKNKRSFKINKFNESLRKASIINKNLDNLLTQDLNYFNNINSVKNMDYLEKLKNKNDFFKISLRSKSLKNIQNPKTSKKEKKFNKENYMTTMKDFVRAVNTECDYYTQTFSDIEKGIKNYDFIQSVHYDIPPDKLLDKKMMYHDKFVRKYFIYGTQGGAFISEDKQNDDIIERSDNLAKITPEISYKFKKMILERFSEKPLVDFSKFLEPNSYKAQKFKENSKKVAKLIDDTDKRRARVENDLTKLILKTKETD